MTESTARTQSASPSPQHVLISPRLHDHPATLRAKPRGMVAWTLSICWLSRNSRAEAFPRRIAREFYATPRITESLIGIGLWEDEGDDIYVPQWPLIYGRRSNQLWKFGPLARSRSRIPEDVRLAVYGRDGWACLRCGATEPLSLDHIHPWSRGGEDTFDNLQTLCRPCNSRKGARV